MASLYTGSCLCGGVSFHIDTEFAPVQICHCLQCRKAQGTVMVSNSPVAASAFHLDSGAELLTSYESSPGKERVFCRRCGSPVYSRRQAMPEVLRIRLGLINEPLTAPLSAHFHVESKAGWWPLDDDLPKLDGSPRAL